MKAKARHELKQNEIAELATRAAAWVTGNRDRAAILAITVVAVVVVAAGYAWWQRATNDKAGALLGKAEAIAQSVIAPASTVPGAAQQAGTYPTVEARFAAALDAYRAVIDAYPSADAALSARYAIANGLLAGGRPDEAERAFGEVRAAAGASLYGALAQLGRGQALVAQGKHADAITLLTELAADRTSALPLDGVLIQLARASVGAGRLEEARATLKRIVDEFPASGFAAEARQELVRLG